MKICKIAARNTRTYKKHSHIGITQIPSCVDIKVQTLEKQVQELQEKLKQEKIWKEEDPRMLREQIRVHDVAFQHLHEQHKSLEHRSQEQAALIEKLVEALKYSVPTVINSGRDEALPLAHAQGFGKKEQ